MQRIDLWRMLGYVVASADQIMSAAPAALAMAQLLDLEPRDPIFCFRRLMRDADRRPMGLLYSSFRWARFTYSMSLKQSEVEAQGLSSTYGGGTGGWCRGARSDRSARQPNVTAAALIRTEDFASPRSAAASAPPWRADRSAGIRPGP
jgi:UTRA domain